MERRLLLSGDRFLVESRTTAARAACRLAHTGGAEAVGAIVDAAAPAAGGATSTVDTGTGRRLALRQLESPGTGGGEGVDGGW